MSFIGKDWVIIIQDEIIKGLYDKIERLEKKINEKQNEEAVLKSCPHCGGDAKFYPTEDKAYEYQICCTQCLCGTDENDDKEECIDDWNRRV